MIGTAHSVTIDGETAGPRAHHGRLVAVVIGSTTLYAFLLRALATTWSGRFDSTWVSAGVLLGCIAIYVPLMLRSGLPLASFGLTLRNAGGQLRESLAWSTAFLAALTLLKLVGLRVIPAWHGEPLFSMYGFTRYDSLGEALGLIAVYSCFVPVQELIARGVMQSSLERLLEGRHRTLLAIVLSTLMFSQIHLHLNATYALSVMVPSLFWGAMYARQRSLLGVSLSHLWIGIYVAFFLGLPTLEHATR